MMPIGTQPCGGDGEPIREANEQTSLSPIINAAIHYLSALRAGNQACIMMT
jgi:hypothetical protein